MRFPWKAYLAELIGTALLISVGLSVVILDFGQSSPIIGFLADAGLRRLITGFLFGTTGALIAISPLGKESGAHINPVVTLGFWMMGCFKARQVPGYVISQLAGAVIGAVPLLAWGALGRSVEYGATVPGYGDAWALIGEAVTTFALVFLLFYFLRHPRLKHITPALFPPLYAMMVWLEAPVSGTSTNPARSLGPAVIANDWHSWWIYWLGPLIGALLAVVVHRTNVVRLPWIEVAKIHHFKHDRYGLFHL
ncbi:MAG: aquaporin [Rhizomicrobium sp.]|nr:aquaporin [Rhizomicrobium sp.]